MNNTIEQIQLPCIVEKCLIYPVCKHKRYIECDVLSAYYIDNPNISHKSLWLALHEVFPLLAEFTRQDKVLRSI